MYLEKRKCCFVSCQQSPTLRLFRESFYQPTIDITVGRSRNLCNWYLAPRSGGCELSTQDEMKKSVFQTTNQLTKKSGLILCAGLIIVQLSPFQILLSRLKFLLQNDGKEEKVMQIHFLPVLNMQKIYGSDNKADILLSLY